MKVLYSDLPRYIQDWATACLGARVSSFSPARAGFMPGCVGVLHGVQGERAFIKVVSRAQYPNSAARLASEVEILGTLSGVAHVPKLLGAHDGDGWVGLIETFVPGRQADLTDRSQFDAVLEVLEYFKAQEPDLSRLGDLRSMSNVLENWVAACILTAQGPGLTPLRSELLRLGQAHESAIAELPGLVEGQLLCHWDLSESNILISDAGDAFVVDWASAKLGPPWMDVYFLLLNIVDLPIFDDWAARLSARFPLSAAQLNAMLVLQSLSWLHLAHGPAVMQLPGLREDRLARAEKVRVGLVRRRQLGLG